MPEGAGLGAAGLGSESGSGSGLDSDLDSGSIFSAAAPSKKPPETLLAFDYGTKKIGIAIGNTVTGQARPLEILAAPDYAARFARIAALIATWQPERLVVGLPLTTDGAEQPSSQQSRRFARQLQGRYRLPVVLVDERGSSLEAQAFVGNAPDDSVAAAIILQRYLDRCT